MENTFYSRDELLELGFKSLGENLMISKKASFYGTNKISIGNNVRIDDYCLFTGGKKGIQIGSFVHIAAFCYVSGGGLIIIEDFCTISSRVALYSSSDDYSGQSMISPMVSEKFTNVLYAPVILRNHSIIGTGSTVLPGVELAEGTAVGCMSLVNKNIGPWAIFAGIPAKYIKPRYRNILELEKKFKETLEKSP